MKPRTNIPLTVAMAFLSMAYEAPTHSAGTEMAPATAQFSWGPSQYTWTGNFSGSKGTDIASAAGGNVYVHVSSDPGFTSHTWTVPGFWGLPGYTWVGDFSGDGRTDIASASGGSVYMSISTGERFTSATWSVPATWGTAEYTWVGDFNGDGRTDIASALGTNVYMNLSTGSGFTSQTWKIGGLWGASAYTWVADFNGDRKTDIASAIGTRVYVYLSTGSGFASQIWTIGGLWGASAYTWVADFDGDDKADITSAIGTSVYVNLSTGSGFSSRTWTISGLWGASDYTWAADFNGDKKTDIASAIGTRVYVNLSTGSGLTSQTWTVGGVWGASGYTRVGDYNADGMADIASAAGNAVYMNLSTGTGFTGSTWGSSNAADSTFSMVFMSDPQFDWGCAQEKTVTSDYCRNPANWAKDRALQGLETNVNHKTAIQAINGSVRNFKGVVINGDLTDFGNQDGHLTRFRDVYLSMGVPVWPGLGNHDYEDGDGEPVDDCGARSWENRNYCAADMVQFLAGYARSNIRNNDVTRYSGNPGQAGDQRNVSGSLAYSWDIGKFHFVQLNNYPTYTRRFTRGYVSGISSWNIDVTSPAGWLNADLGAAGAGRKIILNWHRFDVYSDPTERAKLIAMLAPYAGSIKAIFVGHYHSYYGMLDALTFPAVTTAVPATATTPEIPVRAAISVPVIYSGSAIYNRFIRADFDTRTGCAITLNVISTSSGSPVAAPSSDGGSGVSTIDCR